jgi:hypothetical protein
MPANDLGCYGRKDHETPRLDRLAKQGMRFTSAYAEPVSPSAFRSGEVLAPVYPMGNRLPAFSKANRIVPADVFFFLDGPRDVCDNLPQTPEKLWLAQRSKTATGPI